MNREHHGSKPREDVNVFVVDTEFLHHPVIPGQPDGQGSGAIVVQPLSIGVVTEGREFYAEIAEALEQADRYANQFLRAHVLPQLTGPVHPRAHVAAMFRAFIDDPGGGRGGIRPEFWSFCGGYDYVAVQGLLGGMTAWPPAWPWYFRDLAELAHYGAPPFDHASLPHHALADARAEFAYLAAQRVRLPAARCGQPDRVEG